MHEGIRASAGAGRLLCGPLLPIVCSRDPDPDIICISGYRLYPVHKLVDHSDTGCARIRSELNVGSIPDPRLDRLEVLLA